jgi:hypothetical protein
MSAGEQAVVLLLAVDRKQAAMDRAETEGKERREKSAGTQLGCEPDDGRTL